VSTLKDKLNAIEIVIDALTDQAEAEFLERVAWLSRQMPDRVLTVVGGNGALYVDISQKVTCPDIEGMRYGSGGEGYYRLSHGEFSSYEAPEMLRNARHFLFDEMEQLEAGHILWHFAPMIAPGYVMFKDGQKFDRT